VKIASRADAGSHGAGEGSDEIPEMAGGGWTGIGSMPGVDPFEAARVVVGETPTLPALPELPARGPGADMIGRTAAMLDGITVALVPTGWRVADRPGAEMRKARSWLAQDLDAFEEAAADHVGSVKVQVVGPWTLAAGIELAGGESLLRDHGARRDLVEVLAEAVSAHVREVRRRLPDAARVVLQMDEPSIGPVLLGRVPTASGWATYRSLDRAEVRDGISAVAHAARDAGAVVAVHSCAGDAPLDLLLETAPDALSFDLSLVTTASVDVLAAAVESGVVLIPGILDAASMPMSGVMDTVGRVQRWWTGMGFATLPAASAITLSPTCGLAGTSAAGTDPASARAVLHRLGEVAKALEEDPDGDHVKR
jgi:methionine synthase II (cobalamin-independent)